MKLIPICTLLCLLNLTVRAQTQNVPATDIQFNLPAGKWKPAGLGEGGSGTTYVYHRGHSGVSMLITCIEVPDGLDLQPMYRKMIEDGIVLSNATPLPKNKIGLPEVLAYKGNLPEVPNEETFACYMLVLNSCGKLVQIQLQAAEEEFRAHEKEFSGILRSIKRAPSTADVFR